MRITSATDRALGPKPTFPARSFARYAPTRFWSPSSAAWCANCSSAISTVGVTDRGVCVIGSASVTSRSSPLTRPTSAPSASRVGCFAA